jgi:agmatine deiminase
MPATWTMPAEWAPHEGTWLAWPHEKSDWPGKFGPIPHFYGKLIAKLTRYEMVHLLCADERAAQAAVKAARQEHANLAALDLHLVPTDRSWLRDTAPIFVKSTTGKLKVTDWHFNGWAKYDNWQNDDALPEYIAAKLGLPRVQPLARQRRVVLEGGSIDVNGAGTLLTTEECLLSPVQARNPHLTKAQIEAVLAKHLGVTKVLWLGNGIAGDDTHGHVDDLARFTDPQTIVTVVEADPADPNYEPLQDNLRRLREMTDQDGRPLRIVTLPMPAPVRFADQRLPASYANFYIANQQVLVPTFNDPNDRHALNTLAGLFPDRAVVGIDCSDLVLGLGTLHCMTQQQPA